MNWRNKGSMLLLVLLVALVWAYGRPAASNAQAETPATHYVRIPAAQVPTAARLNLQPQLALDYGSYQWLSLSAADYARLAASDVAYIDEPEAGQVQILHYRFDPILQGEPTLPEGLATEFTGPALRLVQFAGPISTAWLEAMQDAGLPPLQYYPHNAYLTWGTAAQLADLESSPYVRWQGVVHPAYKVDPNLRTRSGVISNVDIMFYNDGNIKATLGAIASLGGNILQYYPSQPDQAFFNAVVQLDATRLDDVAKITPVLWLGYLSPEPILDDEMSSQILAGNYSGAGVPFVGYNAHLASLGFNGAGVIWAIIDTGVDYDHPDLGPNIVGGYSFPGACNPPGQPGSDCSGGGHGTHVAGIVGGTAAAGYTDTNGFLYGLGVAPGYSIFAMNSLSASAWPPAGGWQEHSKRAVLGNAIGGNNSWTTGEGTAHGYQASERTHDFTVLDGNFDTAAIEPFIQVFSAGNSGPAPSTLTAPKEGKNLIIVASSRNFRVGSINDISSFSSRGPAVDGRLGVTIATPGEQIASARNDLGGSCATAIPGTNNLYAFCSGTSMAAPHASGAIVLATQWWRTFNAGANPSPAMAKALLVNSAVDMGAADIPNINEGWGRVNITNMISPTVPVVYYDQTHIFQDSGEQWTLAVGVADPSKPLKVTLAWTDAPGAVGANPALVNNLDLTVINGANTYRGNVFSGGWSTTGGTYDTRNNLENVYIQNPAGSAVIIIDAVNIAGDAVFGNADLSDQNFALICQNCALFPDFTLTVSPSVQNICAPADALFDVAIGSILGYNDPVTLSATGNPAGTTVGFSVNPVTPPGSSQLTIGNTGSAAAGSYNIEVTGTAITSTNSATVQLNLFTASPTPALLQTPANGSLNVPATPTFSWSDTGATSYLLQVATDINFSNIVYSATVNGTSHTAASALNTSTTYFWRVQGSNACGTGNFSAVFMFTTVAAPGDCGPGTTPNVIYDYGFESGAAGWTTPAGVGTNTWAIVNTAPYAGLFHYRGLGTASVTDQRLVSPPIALPTGENPVVLNFWHRPNLEPSGATACYDGGILEVSTDAGATWNYVPNASLLVGPYRSGTVSGSFGNPLAGLNAWCGVTTYMNTIADMSSYAGQTVQFRFRIGTDSSVGAPGWDVDAVKVQSCVPANVPAISLTKTVGTNPNVYPMTQEITVTNGMTVTYFYVVENTGDVMLPLHTLQDSHAGMVLGPDFPYDLQPGETVTITTSLVVTETVTGVANWVATDGGTNTAVASDSTTVTVVNPAIRVSKTVGTEAGVCASTNEIDVLAGTTVYYCYSVTNIGDVTLSLHDLVDDQLGTILSGFAFDLLPGASVNTVAAGLTISSTIMTTTVNTAVWTAYNDATISASATATANVRTGYFYYLPIILQPEAPEAAATLRGRVR